jgi:glucan 1,4-alpha-glucosidase
MSTSSTTPARHRRVRSVLLAVAMLATVVPTARVAAADPTSVTIAGSLQSEAGCGGDWVPACAGTHLSYDAGDDVWQGTFTLPAEAYEYKAALNDSWTENYGLHAVPDGLNIPLAAPGGPVKFYYDHKTHWATDNVGSVIAVAPGSFQSELGCPGDWQPGCLRSWLEDPDGDGTYTFETTALPHGSYESKVAINESWDENYGAGGAFNGDNIAFSVPADHSKVTFSYVASTHVLSISVEVDHGAPGAPGALSHFDLARKDCLGTARNTTSKVWFTVANGILSDVYYPTIDNTNVETLQYVVTDGLIFTDLQARDMTSTVEAVTDSGGMACRVTTRDENGLYQIETTYITDPARDTLLMKVAFTPSKSSLQLFVRFDPTVNGNGGGGSGNGGADDAQAIDVSGHKALVASDVVTATNAANRDYAQPVFAALDGPFDQASAGFVGSESDGLVQLDSRVLSPAYPAALGGNVVGTARVVLGSSGKVTLALGFGSSDTEAIGAAEASLGAGFDPALVAYRAGWSAYDATLKNPHTEKLPGLSNTERKDLQAAYYLNANVLKASEDKTFPGAMVASLASPWGQAVSAGDPNNTYFGSYREVFARDLYEAWTGLVAAGDLPTARAATSFLFERQQQPDGSMPRNSLVNGKLAPDSFNTQLDEAAYPILMAQQLGMTDASLYANHVKPAANFIAAHGPSFGVERWEEQSGYSPSTIAAEVAGLVAAADLAKANGDSASAAVWLGVADDMQRSVKGWTVTTNGPLSTDPYFLRLSKEGDPNAAMVYNVGNGGPDLDQRRVIDAGFLELVRLGELPASDADVARTLQIVDAQIRSTTPSGFGWHRYNRDGYGDRASDGQPWAPSGQGTGHVWPVLSAERAEQALASGDAGSATSLLQGMRAFASGVGLIPEQDWETANLAASPFGTDPTTASIGFVNGKAAGSASPLTWGSGSFVRLAADLAAGKNVVLPAVTTARYVTQTQGQTTLNVTAPTDKTAVDASPVTVTGTTATGNTVYVAATNTDANSATTVVSAPAAGDGSFSIPVPVTGGTTVLNVVAVSPNGVTAHEQRTVVLDIVPGTLLLDVSDPDGDDHGPGNYAYPLSSNFKAGAFDLERFQVYDAGTDVVFRVRTRDLTATFGSALGAQLVDVYVHIPGASVTSTAAANGTTANRNFTIDPSGAWSRLIQVQGFGQRYEDASHATLGQVSISGNAISRYITFRVPKASLGQPGPGWVFTVVLTGQDGFSNDQARTFLATPADFNFGVCAASSSDPHCTVNPATVPKAMDVITPAGVDQSVELDYTLGPVVLKGVSIPAP